MADCPVCELHAESVFKIEGMDCHEEVAILERRLKRSPGSRRSTPTWSASGCGFKYDAAKLTTSRLPKRWPRPACAPGSSTKSPSGLAPSLRRERLVAPGGRLPRAWPGAPAAGGAAPLRVGAALRRGGRARRQRRRRAAPGRRLDRWPPRHQRPDAGRRGRRDGARRVGRRRVGRVPVRARAAARGARDGARARRHPGADGSGAGRGARPARRRRTHDGRSTRSRSATSSSSGPGEKIPLDGRVHAGESHVNQAPVTGESLPVEKTAGDEVFAGTINGRGALDVAVTRLRRDSTLARIIHLVERAQAQRAPSQTFVDRFARVYTPVVLVLAVAIARGAAARARRAVERLDLSLARAARHLVPVRARHLDAGVDRLGAGRRRAQGRAHQGRRASRAARGGALRRVRQDRHADQGAAARRRRRAGQRRRAGRDSRARRLAREPLRASDRPRDRRARARPMASRSRRSSAFEALPGLGAEAHRRRRAASSSAAIGCSSERGSCSGRPWTRAIEAAGRARRTAR